MKLNVCKKEPLNFVNSLLCVRYLDWVFCSIRTSCIFLVGFMETVHAPPNSAKYKFLGKFRSHNTIYSFKNYFAIVFSVINFQFSANKWYSNTPYVKFYFYGKFVREKKIFYQHNFVNFTTFIWRHILLAHFWNAWICKDAFRN